MREGRCGRVSSTDSIHRFQSLLMFFPVNSPPFGDFSCITDLVLPSTFVNMAWERFCQGEGEGTRDCMVRGTAVNLKISPMPDYVQLHCTVLL